MKEQNVKAEEVYELLNADEQITFEFFKIVQDNFSINKCENCGRLFIPITSSVNKEVKGRSDQKYCNNLYLDTGKTCKEIGALKKRKEKIESSSILKVYQKEYKRIYSLHYHHLDKFTEKKFKEWSKKAQKLKTKYTDSQIDEFKLELKELSSNYWIFYSFRIILHN